MPRPIPFTGHLVAASRAHAVVAPPYDALTPDQRTAMAVADPESFLNALPTGGLGDENELERTLAACRASVDRLLAGGRFTPLDRPAYAVIGIGGPSTRMLAVVADLPHEVFDLEASGADGKVRPHERVDPSRVHQLARYLEVVGVASSPVAVTHRPHTDVTAATQQVVAAPPRLGFRGDDGVDIAVWVVDDEVATAALGDAIAAAGTLYIADGHHRAAAVEAYASAHGRDGSHPAGRVLTAMIPSDHLDVLPFHRRIVGAPDPSAAGVVGRLLDAGFDPVQLTGPTLPARAGEVTLTVEGRWWSLLLPSASSDDPVERLDVRRVEQDLLPALLGGPVQASAPTGDAAAGSAPRLEPSAAPAGLGALEGPGTIGVALAPPGVDAILEVADARGAMPPKTTYVTPKLRSGIFLAPR